MQYRAVADKVPYKGNVIKRLMGGELVAILSVVRLWL